MSEFEIGLGYSVPASGCVLTACLPAESREYEKQRGPLPRAPSTTELKSYFQT